jgi:hypothetical protein
MSRTSTTSRSRTGRSERKAVQPPQAPSTTWQGFQDSDDQQDETEAWDDELFTEHSSKARRRIEMLREERLLQQLLTDSFDF